MSNNTIDTLNLTEIAKFIGRSRVTVARMKKAGQLPPAIMVGQRLEWRRSDLEKMFGIERSRTGETGSDA